MVDLSGNRIDFQYIKDFSSVPTLDTLDGETKITYYEELLSKSLIERASLRDSSVTADCQDKIFPHIKHVLEWLRNSDFYTSPASTKYHDACYAGLLTHTLKVYNQLVDLRVVYKFRGVVYDQWWSVVFAALVHDWCKIGRYESYYKNVKQDNGEWQQVLSYKYKESNVARFGHSTQSLVMAMQLCNTKLTSLTFEEMAAIRWHMDNWDMTTYDATDLQHCNENIPMVRMLQFADQLAVTTY